MSETGFTVLIPRILNKLGVSTSDIDGIVKQIRTRIGDPSPFTLNALIDALLADVGDASGSTLGSIYSILGNPPSTIAAQNAGILAAIGVHDTSIKVILGTPTLPATIDSLIDSIITYVNGIKGTGWDGSTDTLFEVGKYIIHNTLIFPEATSSTVTLNSHANADTWSVWTEIVDAPGGTTFTSQIDAIAHITSICIEDTSVAGEIWMMEISYGDAHVPVARLRFVSGAVGILPAVQQFRIRGAPIPVGQTVYYRLMCSVGNKNCKIHLRYYKHP